MTDIASLSYSVDTSSVKAGTTALQQHSAAAKQASQSATGYNDALAKNYDIGTKLTSQQASTIRGLEDQITRTQLSGKELAVYTALRKSATNGDTQAGQVIANLAGVHYDLADAQKKAGTASKELGDTHLKTGAAAVHAGESMRGMKREVAELAEGMSLLGGPAGELFRSFGGLYVGSLHFTPALIGLTVAVGAFAAGLEKSVEAYGEYQSHQATVRNVLALTQNASQQNVHSLNENIEAMSKSGTQSVSDLRAAQVELLKYRNVSGDVFTRASKQAQDLANVGFVDIKTAAAAYGKALQDPIGGLDALRDAGIRISPVQEKLIADLVKTGQSAAALNTILTIGASGTADATATRAETLSSKLGKVINAAEELATSWGKDVAEGLHLSAVLDLIARGLQDIINKKQKASEGAAAGSGFSPTATIVGAVKAVASFAYNHMSGIPQIAAAVEPSITTPAQNVAGRFPTASQNFKPPDETGAMLPATPDIKTRTEALKDQMAQVKFGTEEYRNLASQLAQLTTTQNASTASTKSVGASQADLINTLKRVYDQRELLIRQQASNDPKVSGAASEKLDQSNNDLEIAERRARAAGVTQDQIDSIEKSSKALREEGETSKMTAAQLKQYNDAKAAGVVGNKAATDAISSERNAIESNKFAVVSAQAAQQQVNSLNVEAGAFGMATDAAAKYRFVQTELNSAKMAGITLSPQQVAAITSEGDAIAAATRQLDAYKNAKQAADAISGGFVDALFSWASGAKTASAALKDLALSLSKMALQAVLAGSGPFAGVFGTNASGGLLGGLLKAGIGGLIGAGSIGSQTAATAVGIESVNASAESYLAAFAHSGGIAGSAGLAGRYVHPAYFDDAYRYKSGGIAGLAPDEVPIVAHRGEEVLRRDDPRHRANGGGMGDQLHVHYDVDARGADPAAIARMESAINNSNKTIASQFKVRDRNLQANISNSRLMDG